MVDLTKGEPKTTSALGESINHDKVFQIMQVALGTLLGAIVMLIVAWFGFKGTDENRVKELIKNEKENNSIQSQLQVLQSMKEFDSKLDDIKGTISSVEKSQLSVSKDVEILKEDVKELKEKINNK